MSTKQYSNPMLNTLGFFLQGVPVVFVRTDIVFAQQHEHVDYLRFYQECQIDRRRNACFAGKDLMRGFKYAATINHEIKHFHDALLCRPLFELFLLRNKINWCVAQLARHFRGLSVGLLPLDYKIDHPNLVTPEGAFLLKEIKRLVFEFSQYYTIVFQPVIYNNINLTLTDLLETSAILLELVNVLSVHGERGAQDYYQQVVLDLPDEYSYLLRTFVQRRGNLTAALLPLYTLLAYSLYCSDSPVQTLVKLLQSGTEDIPDSVLDSLQTAVMTVPFDREDELKKRIEKMQLSAPDGSKFDVGHLESDNFAGPMLAFHKTIYDCRERVLRVYVSQFQLALDTYLERLDELPLPPVLFFPGEEQEAQGHAYAISERQVRELGHDLHIICATQNGASSDSSVIAGLTNVAGVKSAVDLHVADMQLVNLFLYKTLFEKHTTKYSLVIDHMYQKIFDSYFLHDC